MIDAIAAALEPTRIRLELAGRRKPEVIGELVDLVADAGLIEDRDALVRLVLEREALATTGVGDGIGIPHCFVSGLADTVLVAGRSSKGVKFDAVDRRPVHLVFLILGPPDSHQEHLRLLSRLARFLNDTALRSALMAAPTAEEFHAVLARREAEGR